MATEWNINVVNEYLLKLDMANTTKKILKCIEEKGVDILNSNLTETKADFIKIENRVREIPYYVNEAYYHDEEYDYPATANSDLYFVSIYNYSQLIELAGVELEINEMEEDGFIRDVNSLTLKVLDKFKYFFKEQEYLRLDEVEDMISSGRCFMKIKLKNNRLMQSVRSNDVIIELLVNLIGEIYFIEPILLQTNEDEIVLYGVHDISDEKNILSFVSSIVKFRALKSWMERIF